MDTLHHVISSIHTETKAERDPVSVFRKFLAHLDQMQRKTPAKPSRVRPSSAKPPPRSKPGKRGR